MRSLNMWKRLGIVLSAVWAVSAFGYTWVTENDRATSFGGFAANVCEEGRQVNHPSGPDDCWNKVFVENYNIMAKSLPADSAFMALLPLPFFWLFAWGIVAVVRWVLRGRELAAP